MTSLEKRPRSLISLRPSSAQAFSDAPRERTRRNANAKQVKMSRLKWMSPSPKHIRE